MVAGKKSGIMSGPVFLFHGIINEDMMERRGGFMKKLVFFLLAVFLAVLLGACTQAQKEPGRLFLIKEKGMYG